MTTPRWMDHHPHHDPQPWPYEAPDPASANQKASEPGRDAQLPAQEPHAGHSAHGGHGLMMLVCCIPMILLAVALVATGVAGSGAIVGALLCTAMMAVMMLAMPGGHDHK
ncbi:hypothetical protein [Nocardioides abyssi]|uniref:DUF2933 domain-containing protein n=1 Tax=Nocardioides abyssi TaxID=3058370 RepID=A0ABT8ESH9_9ACTN|nr:hypothetical protein [Nocardioides abyssi]MDN4160961.1 hypothetical protein [Nocardioides abyssi]